MKDNREGRMMTELEKLDAGLPYCFTDPEVAARKNAAAAACARFNALDPTDVDAQTAMIKQIFGATGERVSVQQGFACDTGWKISVGEDFIANYNVTILDIAEVVIGDHCMIGPNVLITSVGHPLDAAGRRARLGEASPVTIGDDVWIGGNCVVLPGVTIGSNVVVAAGAVVSKDIPDNCVVGGVPARVLRQLDPTE